MLKEILQRQENSEEKNRRWFQSPDMGLFIWSNNDENIVRFQLIYTAYGTERTLEWSEEAGMRNFHSETFRYGSAVLSSKTDFNVDALRKEFEAMSQNIDKNVRTFVLQQLFSEPSKLNQSVAAPSPSSPDLTFMLILALILLLGIVFICLLAAF